MRMTVAAVLVIAMASCSRQHESKLVSSGCRHFDGSLAVDIANSQLERSGLELLIFDPNGITFHLSPAYFAKQFTRIDSVTYEGSALRIVFTEGGTPYTYILSDVDKECGARALTFWAEKHD